MDSGPYLLPEISAFQASHKTEKQFQQLFLSIYFLIMQTTFLLLFIFIILEYKKVKGQLK